MLKRPLCVVAVFYIIGIIMGLYLKISIVFLVLVAFIGSICFYIISKKIKYVLVILVIFLGAISIKIVDISFENMYNLVQEDEIYHIKAIVVSDINKKEYKDVYKIEIKEIDGNKEFDGSKWLLNYKNSTKKILEFGDLIEFNGNIEIPFTARNYMGFDYQRYLKSQKIYGNIFVGEDVKIVAKNKVDLLERIFHYVAVDMKERLYKLLPEDIKELCIGILIGDRSDIKEEITDAFRNSNLTHMLAVSGAHISYIVLGISIILSKAGKKFSKIFTIIFLLFFMGVTKFTPSVERASIMAILVLLSSMLYRKSDVYTNLALSSMIILISNPYAILDIGFQLSYGGTIGIILLDKKISKWFYKRIHLENDNQGCDRKKYVKKIFKYILDIFIVTICANIIILPIMAFHFNTISFTFWISNVLAGPLLGCITILGFILYFISLFSMGLAKIVAFLLQYLIQLLISIANFGENIPFSSVTVKTPYIFEIFLYYIGIYVFFHLHKVKKICKIFVRKFVKYYKSSNHRKNIIIFMSIATIFLMTTFIQIINCNRGLKIYFVDVGQGDCTLICTTKNKTILIDGGGSETGSFNVGEQTLLPYLLDRRITTIDYIMISHFDSDHVRTAYCMLWKK